MNAKIEFKSCLPIVLSRTEVFSIVYGKNIIGYIAKYTNKRNEVHISCNLYRSYFMNECLGRIEKYKSGISITKEEIIKLFNAQA